MKLIPPDSNGGASAPGESPSSNHSSSAALAPAALNSTPAPGSTPSPSGEGGGEGSGTVQPATALTPDQVAAHFQNLLGALTHLREAIQIELNALASRCPDRDTFIDGCGPLSREARKLNTYLVDLQFAIRFGGKLP